MVSNLLVVLCAEPEAQPVINAGTLYPWGGLRRMSAPERKSLLLRLDPKVAAAVEALRRRGYRLGSSVRSNARRPTGAK